MDQLSYLETNKAYMGSGGMVSTMSDYSNFCQMLVDEVFLKEKTSFQKRALI